MGVLGTGCTIVGMGGELGATMRLWEGGETGHQGERCPRVALGTPPGSRKRGY